MSGEREEELTSIQAIYPEIVLSPANDFSASLDLAVQPAEPLQLKFDNSDRVDYYKHLPPLKLHIELPENYPELDPPKVSLSSQFGWLPVDTLLELQDAVVSLWEEYGHCQILFAYIDHLQQYISDLGLNVKPFVLPADLQPALQKFDTDTKKIAFNIGTYDCGVCLEPKKGHSCHQLDKCGHIFCKQCYLDFYNNAITEGDVTTVRCLDPECGKGSKGSKGKKLLHPRELLAIGLDESMVRRYVEMKRKKKMESDKSTVYCPRPWCQKPARSAKYPLIPENLLDYPDMSDTEEVEIKTDDIVKHPPVPNKSGDDERLAICEGCKLAFCKTCFSTWHGSYKRCYPRDASELTAEEKASYDYITANTSPCPTCSAAISKEMGCNHMQCGQCQTHFCYLCSSWLEPGNPYQHFNTPGTGCYQRLWELEEGDNGQGPQDGRGFAGARGAEVLAIDVIRRMEIEDAEAVQVEEEALPAREAFHRLADVLEDRPEARQEIELAFMAMEPHLPVPVLGAQVNRDVRAAHPRRQRNPFPARGRGQGGRQGQAVRAHERQAQARPRRPDAPPVDDEARQEEEMRRFVALALRDEEDDWDSDELAEDDADFRIR